MQFLLKSCFWRFPVSFIKGIYKTAFLFAICCLYSFLIHIHYKNNHCNIIMWEFRKNVYDNLCRSKNQILACMHSRLSCVELRCRIINGNTGCIIVEPLNFNSTSLVHTVKHIIVIISYNTTLKYVYLILFKDPAWHRVGVCWIFVYTSFQKWATSILLFIQE